MDLIRLPYNLTICRLERTADIHLDADFYFFGKTDDELSLVCKTEDVPAGAAPREDGWKGFRVQGVLDFSLTGILAELSGILARNGIGIFSVSTYNTDYILVKAENFDRAAEVLAAAGHSVE